MKIKARGAEYVEIDYTPMIDMTFQLIAFFMILINFSDGEAGPARAAPLQRDRQAAAGALETPITIQMVRDGKIVMNGQLLTEVDAIRPFLKAEKADLQLKNRSAKDATIIIRAHKDAKTGLVQRVIKVCQEAGLREVHPAGKIRNRVLASSE